MPLKRKTIYYFPTINNGEPSRGCLESTYNNYFSLYNKTSENNMFRTFMKFIFHTAIICS